MTMESLGPALTLTSESHPAGKQVWLCHLGTGTQVGKGIRLKSGIVWSLSGSATHSLQRTPSLGHTRSAESDSESDSQDCFRRARSANLPIKTRVPGRGSSKGCRAQDRWWRGQRELKDKTEGREKLLEGNCPSVRVSTRQATFLGLDLSK